MFPQSVSKRATPLMRAQICLAILQSLHKFHQTLKIYNNNLLPSNIFVKWVNGEPDIKFVDWSYFSKVGEEVTV